MSNFESALELVNDDPDDNDPVSVVANKLAFYVSKTFQVPATPDNFRIQAANIVKALKPAIAAEALTDIRKVVERGKPVIERLYGAIENDGSEENEPYRSAYSLLARIWLQVNDGSLDPPTWRNLYGR